MGRRGGLGGGSRGGFGGGRGGGFGGSRGSLGGGRGFGSGAGSSGRLGGTAGRSGGLGGAAPRPAVRPGARRGPGFGTGMAVGMGMGMGMGRRRRFGMGGFGMGRRGMGMGRRGGCGGGCLMPIIILLVLIAIIWFANSMQGPIPQPADGLQITQSTRVRDRLELNPRTDIPLFTDNLGWINNRGLLEDGLLHFFHETGVRPHLYLVGVGDVPGTAGLSIAELADFLRDGQALYEFAEEAYDRLLPDENHMLFVFFYASESVDDYIVRFELTPGRATRPLVDDQVANILMDYVEHFFYVQPPVSEEAIFANAFYRTATRIMARPANNRPVWMTLIIVAGVILLVVLLINQWKRRKDQQNLEAEQTERILGQDLNTFGSGFNDEASRRAQEYDDDNQ